MTTSSRFERQLPAILEDLYLGPSPDYRDEVLATATGSRQRPAWTFPGRWLPVTDIASPRTLAPRLLLRTIAVGLAIIALLLAVATVYLGSRQTKLPPPFGVARNGLVVYAAGGDIYAADPVTGKTRAIVTGPEMDGNPRFSRDGTRVAFMRRVGASNDAFDLVVGTSEGKDLKVLTTTPVDTHNPYEWSPDGTFLVFTDSSFRVLRIEADGSSAPTVIRESAHVQVGGLRPPDGREILFEPQGDCALWVMNADGTGARPVYEIPASQMQDGYFGAVRYSPDGNEDRVPSGSAG
jgi:WD40-like Beta Propeller Repeat